MCVVVTDSHKNVRRRGTKRTVGIAAEICPKIVVEMLEALQSGMMELEMRISKVSSASQPFVYEIHHVTIRVKYLVHREIVVSMLLYGAEA